MTSGVEPPDDGPVPLVFTVADGVTVVAPTDDRGVPAAVIETENETVRVWAEAEIDGYRPQSTEVTADDLPIPRPERNDTR